MSKNPESGKWLDTLEKYNKVTLALGAAATVASAVILQSPELTTFFATAVALDIAGAGLIKVLKNRKNKSSGGLAPV